jgi:hypothetical protein
VTINMKCHNFDRGIKQSPARRRKSHWATTSCDLVAIGCKTIFDDLQRRGPQAQAEFAHMDGGGQSGNGLDDEATMTCAMLFFQAKLNEMRARVCKEHASESDATAIMDPCSDKTVGAIFLMQGGQNACETTTRFQLRTIRSFLIYRNLSSQ